MSSNIQNPSYKTSNEKMNKDETEDHLNRPGRFRWWLLVIVNIVFAVVGQAVATLLGRFYYDKGGSSTWLSSLTQAVGFPVLLIPYFFLNHHNNHQTCSNYLHLLILYLVLGILFGAANLLSAFGLMYLSASTFSLISAMQLVFMAVFSLLINRQKFNILIINSVVILCLSSCLLAVNSNSDSPSGVSDRKHLIGIFATLASAAFYSLILSLYQLASHKLKMKQTFSTVIQLLICVGFVSSLVTVIGLLKSGQWRSLAGEMDLYATGKVSYVMTLLWIAISWQVCYVGLFSLVFLVSSLFSDTVSTVAFVVSPIMAVIVFHDKMDGIKIIAMLMGFWGLTCYIYQNYDKLKRGNASDADEEEGIEINGCGSI